MRRDVIVPLAVEAARPEGMVTKSSSLLFSSIGHKFGSFGSQSGRLVMRQLRNIVIAPLVLVVIAVLAFVATDPAAQSNTTLVSFRGAIGVEPVSAGAGTDVTSMTVTRNIVRGVQPPAQPWKIADFQAKVNADGHITARGRGLVFAGGNSVGTSLLISSTGTTTEFMVFATLICQNVAPFVELNTKPVPLPANGNFAIDDVLSPPPSAPCTTPVLLIRNTTNLTWFAAGIQQSGR
jgi:hypothetical protein